MIILSSKHQETYIQQKLEHQEIEYGISNWGNLLGRLAEQAVTTLRLSNIFGKPSFRHYSQVSFIKQVFVKGGFKLSFYGGLKLYDLGGLGIDRCQAI